MTTPPRVCAICQALGTEKWTLGRGDELFVADLCIDHSHSLVMVADAVGPIGTTASAGGASPSGTVKPGKVTRALTFEPLDWTPPLS